MWTSSDCISPNVAKGATASVSQGCRDCVRRRLALRIEDRDVRPARSLAFSSTGQHSYIAPLQHAPHQNELHIHIALLQIPSCSLCHTLLCFQRLISVSSGHSDQQATSTSEICSQQGSSASLSPRCTHQQCKYLHFNQLVVFWLFSCQIAAGSGLSARFTFGAQNSCRGHRLTARMHSCA